MRACGDPERPLPRASTWLLVGLAENYAPEHPRAAGVACANAQKGLLAGTGSPFRSPLDSTPAVQMTDSPIRSAADAERGLQSADQLRTSRRIANEARNINAVPE